MSSMSDPLPEGQRKVAPVPKPVACVEGKNFIVTGGTQGIGCAIACTLAKGGAKGIVVCGNDEEHKGKEACDKLSHETPEKGGEKCHAYYHMCDLSDAKACEKLFEFAVEKLGEIHGVVNSAACNCRSTATHACDVACFDTVMKTNLRAPWYLTKLASCHMKEKNICGSIVNISAMDSHGGSPNMGIYAVSKCALNGLTKISAHELKKYGIRVNAVIPGLCVTEQEDETRKKDEGDGWVKKADKEAPFGRVLRPEDVAAVVGFLMSEQSIMMTGDLLDLHPEMIVGTWS